MHDTYEAQIDERITHLIERGHVSAEGIARLMIDRDVDASRIPGEDAETIEMVRIEYLARAEELLTPSKSMTLSEVDLYTCRYANTYSVLIAAPEIGDAKDAFTTWLEERVDGPISSARLSVRKFHTRSERPIYTIERQA
jgi:hypothetical protein